MPVYREPFSKYRCRQCKLEFEKRFDTDEQGPVACVSCKNPNVERLISSLPVKMGQG
jgi:putative FmdB family regulatory protein